MPSESVERKGQPPQKYEKTGDRITSEPGHNKAKTDHDPAVLTRRMPQGVLLDVMDYFRLDAGRKLDADRRSQMGQFFTPLSTARFVASMLEFRQPSLRVLDAGAGVGSLTAALRQLRDLLS